MMKIPNVVVRQPLSPKDNLPIIFANSKRIETIGKSNGISKQGREVDYSTADYHVSKQQVINKRQKIHKTCSSNKLVQMNDVGLQSSKGRSDAQSSIHTTNLKRKVYRTISDSKYTIAVKEVSIIVLLNAFIWITCVITLVLLDQTYNKELRKTILLRRYLVPLFKITTSQFRLARMVVEQILTQGQIIDSATKYQSLFTPNTNKPRDYQYETFDTLYKTQQAYVQLKDHIYSFESSVGGVFLQRKASINYSYVIDTFKLNLTKNVEILQLCQEYQLITRRMFRLIDEPGNLQRFTNPYFGQT